MTIAALEELKARPQWVTWAYLDKQNGRRTKPPYRPANGLYASVNEPHHWSDFLTAVRAMRDRHHEGLSFVVTADDPYCGIDLDDCVNPDGSIQPEAAQIVRRFESYTESTPGGTGLRIWIRGRVMSRNRLGKIEIYDRSRAFTVTGKHLDGTPEPIEDRQDELSAFCSELFPAAVVRPLPIPMSTAVYRLSDDEVLRVATRARNGVWVERLLRGDHQGYPTPSEADMALLGFLACYSQDTEQLARLWQGSGLARDKLAQPGYVRRTITLAVKNRRFTYRGRSSAST